MSITPDHNDSGPKRFAHYTTPQPPGQTGPTQRLRLGQAAAAPAAPTSARRTRRTVDLPLATHRALDIWQREAADRMGVARVTGQEVRTALIRALRADS